MFVLMTIQGEPVLMKNKNAVIITALSFAACALHAVMLNTPFNHYAYTSALKGILFAVIPLAYFAVSKQGGLKDLFSVKGHKKAIKQALILGGLVFAFALIAFFALRPLLDQVMIIDGLTNFGITGKNYPFVFIYIIFINAALEELFFRGFVFLTLHRMNYRRYAHIYSSVLFAAYHVSVLNNWVSPGVFALCIAGLVVAGLIFNRIAEKCESVIGSLAVHVGANLAINLIGVYYLYYHPELSS